jgi:hypothetical protein
MKQERGRNSAQRTGRDADQEGVRARCCLTFDANLPVELSWLGEVFVR